jgi:hypothetical protein
VRIELTLLFKYKKYENIFSKEEYEIVSEKISVTHAIDLEEKVKPPHKSIYALSERELRILRDYLTEKKTIGWIRHSKLPVKILILFVSKPDDSLRLYIDYRALNKITIKNRYLLPLINETINRM